MNTNINACYALVSRIADYGTDLIEFTLEHHTVAVRRFFDGRLVKEQIVTDEQARVIWRKCVRMSYVPVL
jgi:hypothetical protein